MNKEWKKRLHIPTGLAWYIATLSLHPGWLHSIPLQFPAKPGLLAVHCHDSFLLLFHIFSVDCVPLCSSVKSDQPMHSPAWYSQHTIGWLYLGRALFTGRMLFMEYSLTGEYYLESVYWFQICKGHNFCAYETNFTLSCRQINGYTPT